MSDQVRILDRLGKSRMVTSANDIVLLVPSVMLASVVVTAGSVIGKMPVLVAQTCPERPRRRDVAGLLLIPCSGRQGT